MIQKLWLKKPKLKYNKDILDIVQFGSSINNENPNDVDIAVIFNKISVKEQLEQAQDIKKQIQKITDKPVHITSFDLQSLFEDSNFSREGLIIYGKSIITGKDFSFLFGLKPVIQINYSLKKFKKRDKIKFHYMLRGKAGKYGLLREYGGQLIHPGLIEISPEHEKIFIEAIKLMIDSFSVKKILIAERE